MNDEQQLLDELKTKEREERRFRAALAVLNGILSRDTHWDEKLAAHKAVGYADELLTVLEKTEGESK